MHSVGNVLIIEKWTMVKNKTLQQT